MRDFDSFIGALKPNASANGLAVFLGKDLMAVDLFHRRDIYAEYLPRLLRAAAFEAQLVPDQKTATPEAEAKYRSTEFLEGIEGADGGGVPRRGSGEGEAVLAPVAGRIPARSRGTHHPSCRIQEGRRSWSSEEA